MDTKENLEHFATLDFESKETWEKDWTTDNPEFHFKEVNSMLIKQYNEFTAGRNNLSRLRPLWVRERRRLTFQTKKIRA